MKTLSIYYNDNQSLINFIDANSINEESNLLIQVFTSSTDKNFIKNLETMLNTKIQRNIQIIETNTDEISSEFTLISIKDKVYKINNGDVLNTYQKHLEEKRIKEISDIYFSDTLTKLYDRNKLVLNLKEYEYLTLALINIDDFSSLNSFYGGDAGDFVLVELSKKIIEVMKNVKCKIYRLNADEFAILKDGELKEKELNKWTQNIVDKLKNIKFDYQKTPIHIELTIGVTSEKRTKPLAHADIALKKAKKDKLLYCIYSENINFTERYAQNIKMAIKIKNALKSDRIISYYQPIIDNKTLKIVKYEALVRLIDDEGNIVSPYFFLNISKKIRLYSQITKAVIRHSFKKFHNSNIDFSINLSIDDIEDKDTVKYLMESLEKYNVINSLIIEITETEEILDYDNMMNFIKKLKALGVKFAIDDFGSGYSNFNYLIKINADIVKIDGSIIKNIVKDPSSRKVTEIIVDAAKKMNMKTLAEFVENEDIFNIVKELGIDYSQGYYFSEPITLDDF